ncbi:MAG: hypothetical protein M3Q03_15185 [Chloroflexota bacterium]|nr:hypothetical protein [Chloroflexota bacterium]
MSLVSLTYLDARKIATAHGRDVLVAAEREHHLTLARRARTVVPSVRASRRVLPLGTLRGLFRPAAA